MSDDAPSSPPSTKRAVLRMTDSDFKRLRILMAKEGLTWQALLSTAVNAWLVQHKHKELKDIK